MQIMGDGIQHGPDYALNGNETVLVVDDVESVRSFLNDALTMFGYSVICAEDRMNLVPFFPHLLAQSKTG